MGDVTVVVVIWAWRCGSGARYSAHAPADRRTDAGTTPAARDLSLIHISEPTRPY